MVHSKQFGTTRDLVESQGVNAGPAVDANVVHVADPHPRGTHRKDAREEAPGVDGADGADGPSMPGRLHAAGAAGPPDELDLLAAGPEKMVGLPGQRPGYPGQQRSVDTS